MPSTNSVKGGKKKKRILVVEDDRFLARALNDKLTFQGYQVELAFQGNEALEKMKQKKPAMVLLDIMLPQKNGFRVLEEMRQNSKLKNVPVIILSNLGQESDINKAKELGANDYFVKADTQLQELVEKVGNLFK